MDATEMKPRSLDLSEDDSYAETFNSRIRQWRVSEIESFTRTARLFVFQKNPASMIP